MLDADLIKKLFHALNEKLVAAKTIGEIGLCGGAVMCLVFQTRNSTKDIDGIFEPTEAVRKAAGQVAKEFSLNEDWLNDAAKGFFLTQPQKHMVLELSHLRVWAPEADYMLAMKCISARFDTHDLDDVTFLIKHLNLKTQEEVFNIITQYYPHNRIPPKTQFLIEELFDH